MLNRCQKHYSAYKNVCIAFAIIKMCKPPTGSSSFVALKSYIHDTYYIFITV